MTERTRLRIARAICFAGYVVNSLGFGLCDMRMIICGSIIFGAAFGYLDSGHDHDVS